MNSEPRRYETRVVSSRQITPSGWELVIPREGMTFTAGRLITIHGDDPTEDRTYTMCSGEGDEHLEILYKFIPTGKLTPKLIQLKAGDPIAFSGPYGEFVIRDASVPIVFVATGTGVAPCRAYVRTHPDLDLTLIHGTPYATDLYYREELSAACKAYHPCVSREESDAHKGRVTDFFHGFEFAPGTHFYLCGANEMIFDMHGLLKDRGVDDSCIFTEAYYYRLHS